MTFAAYADKRDLTKKIESEELSACNAVTMSPSTQRYSWTLRTFGNYHSASMQTGNAPAINSNLLSVFIFAHTQGIRLVRQHTCEIHNATENPQKKKRTVYGVSVDMGGIGHLDNRRSSRGRRTIRH